MKNTKVAAYMRFSSHNQSSTSIESQRMAIRNFCERTNMILVGEYVDEAKSATTDRRPAFQRLMRDAQHNPEWSAVIVYDPSRFARNEEDAFHYSNLLKDCGIQLISLSCPSEETTPESEFMTGMMFTYAAFFSKQLAKRTHDGLTCRAQKGKHCGGIPPLGYDIGKNGKLVVNAVEASVVQDIFAMYLAGMSYVNMADYLNSNGCRTKSGKPFSKNSFYHILTQEKYVGTYRWNKRRAKNSKGHRNNHDYKPLTEQTVIENGCPEIIEREDFDKVQERLAERSHGKADSKSRNHYALGGLDIMHCSHCGARMVGKVTTSHSRKYTSYACPNHRDKGCPTKDITASGIEKYVTAVITMNLIKNHNLPVLNSAVNDWVCNCEGNLLNSKISRLEKQIRNLANSIADSPSKTLLDKLGACEEEKAILEEQKKELLSRLLCITEEEMKPLRKRLAKKLRFSNDPATRTLLKSCIEDILVDNDGITVSLSL